MLNNFLFIECTTAVSKVYNPAIDITEATSVFDCADGSIDKTDFWNIDSAISQGYWHNENNVKTYLELKGNGSLLVS